MSGYPIHNDICYNNGREIYLSDHAITNSKYFIYGFALGCTFIPSTALAVDGVAMPAPLAGDPSGAANKTKALLLAGVCTYTAKCGKEGVEHITKSVAGKATGTPNAVAIGVCLMAAGWCLGRLADKAVDKLL